LKERRPRPDPLDTLSVFGIPDGIHAKRSDVAVCPAESIAPRTLTAAGNTKNGVDDSRVAMSTTT
jgi:hypothetical protein